MRSEARSFAARFDIYSVPRSWKATVATLLNGDQIFPAMLEAIESAQRSITFETYIYWAGEIGA